MRRLARGTTTPRFDPHDFLATVGEGRTLFVCPKGGVIFAQGDQADAIFFIHKGKVRLTVVSHAGKEATIGLVSEGSFFGEGSLAGQAHRTGSATAMTNCELLRVDKALMTETLRRERSLSDLFVSYLLARNIRSEEDLRSTVQLGKVGRPLLLADRGWRSPRGGPENQSADVADMIGTNARVSFFMNRFRRMGFIHYNGGQNSNSLQVHSSLLSVVLHDSDSRATLTPP
jgi:CRP-like cAMP-binding protein